MLLIIGQSNSGNYVGQRYRSEHGEQVINFFAGRCYLASSPLLGVSGIGGESFTFLANKMIESKTWNRVIFGTRWASGDGLELCARGRKETASGSNLKHIWTLCYHAYYLSSGRDGLRDRYQ